MNGIPDLSTSGMQVFARVSRAWEVHEVELRGLLRHGLGDGCAAEDLLPDTVIKATREGPGFCRLDNPRARLFRAAGNAMTDQLRAARPAGPIELHAESLSLAELEPNPPVDALTSRPRRMFSELAPEEAFRARGLLLESAALTFPRLAAEGATVVTF